MRSLKKNLVVLIKSNPEAEIFFFDEARFGTHSNLGHGWFPKGTRTTVKVKIGYQNFYLYGAASPISGEHFELILPSANTECMNIFFQEMSLAIGDRKIIFIMDGAGWHKSKGLIVPPNIIIIFLPPYSPELNPVERLWLYIKQNTIKNKIYHTLKSLEETVSNFIVNIKPIEIISICRENYMFS